ncbi:galactokinase [Hesseltinella vesiculosa]|uniref:Galactokinase n=1 Tax=Hesseltinella vesiculosa TaxID=101127 RepID=A0A1X2GMS8_9FUNG|nr:galactokinase [Hesseltinella vesiculosa]
MSVPTTDSLDTIYSTSSLLKQSQRYDGIITKFKELYHESPEFIVRSPGRVNIIGEHIDYSGFGVLPMAIERDVVQAVSTTDKNTAVHVANTIASKYPARSFDYQGKDTVVTIDATKLEWSNYFKCGYKGMLERAQVPPKGMNVLVDGTVPAGSGLSSSAAFVCSSALAVVTANQLDLSKQELTEIAIVAERNVGVNSGGMDQAASVFSEKNFALHVEFVPRLATQPVQLPLGACFVIAHTLVTADKFTSGPRHYNLRVVETKIGARILGRCLFGSDSTLDTYKEVMDRYFQDKLQVSEADQMTELLALVETHLTHKDRGYTQQEMADAVGLPEQTMVAEYMTRFPVETETFHLYKRAHHVLTEARRVLQFVATCEHASQHPDSVLEKLGGLMNESHTSCDTMFDCSCPELNAVCSLAREHGALGARLTGAGWGGASVLLTTQDKVPTLIHAIKDNYYRQKFPELNDDQLNDAIFPTEPCSGATIFTGFDHT